MQVYSLISSISSDFYMFTPWSLDPFVRVPSQLHGEHTVLQPFRRIELIIHIAISVLTCTHFHLSQVKHFRVNALSKALSGNPAPNGIRNRTAGNDIVKAPRSDHCASKLTWYI